MAAKRSIDAVHPSRREQVPSESLKRQRPDNLGPRSFKKAHPVNALKSRVRDLNRLLAKDDALPPHVRIAKERELQTAQYDLRQSQAAERRSKMISRYHQVRFFDRQKASKRLKRARKEFSALDEADAARQQAQRDVHEAEVNVNYAIYYPLDRPYSCLYPKRKAEEQEDTLTGVNGDQAIRQLVEQCMADGRLKDLREGKLTEQSKSQHSVPVKTASKTKKSTVRADDVDDSDGGFFE